jgi:hypothetical protein
MYSPTPAETIIMAVASRRSTGRGRSPRRWLSPAGECWRSGTSTGWPRTARDGHDRRAGTYGHPGSQRLSYAHRAGGSHVQHGAALGRCSLARRCAPHAAPSGRAGPGLSALPDMPSATPCEPAGRSSRRPASPDRTCAAADDSAPSPGAEPARRREPGGRRKSPGRVTQAHPAGRETCCRPGNRPAGRRTGCRR